MIGSFGKMGYPRPWDTGPINGNPEHQLPGLPMPQLPWQTPPVAGNPQVEPAPGRAGGEITPTKPKFFDQGGTGRMIAGVIGDYLARQAGGPALYDQAMKAHAEETRGLLARQLELNDWKYKEDYKTRNPAPYRFEANNGDQIQIGPDGQARTLYKDPTPKTEWIQVKDPTTGILSVVPKPSGAAPVMPTAPVGRLTPIGGAGSGPRTFR